MVRTCRVCGCTELTPCFRVWAKTEDTDDGVILRAMTRSEACGWVADQDLCTLCPDVKVIKEVELYEVSFTEGNPFPGAGMRVIESEGG